MDFLVKRHLVVAALASLELFVKERTGLLISFIDLQAFVEHLLVLATGTCQLLLRSHLLLLLLGGRSFLSASAHASRHGTYGSVRNGRTGTKGHTLRNGRTNAREHASGLLLHGSRGARRSTTSRRSRSGPSGRPSRGATSTETSTSTATRTLQVVVVNGRRRENRKRGRA